MNALETVVRKLKTSLGLTSESGLVRGVRPAYDALLRRAYGRGGIKREIHGEAPLFLRPECRAYSEDGEAEVFSALRRLARPGAMVLDVGANIGVYSMLLGRWVGASGRVWALEPAPLTYRLLCEHLRLNAGVANVTPIAQAVSDECGEAVFYAHQWSGENSLSTAYGGQVQEAEKVTVPVTTLDEFCRAQNLAPTLIKVDIEGYELHALRGAQETIARHRPAWIIEMHPPQWAQIGVSAEEIADFIAGLPYAVTPVEAQRDWRREFGHILLKPV